MKGFITCYVRLHGEELLALRPSPRLSDHPFQLSEFAYLIYSQLPSVSGGLLYLQPDNRLCPADRDGAIGAVFLHALRETLSGQE